MLVALTREVSASLPKCELTYVQRERIDLPLARTQHARYEEALALTGCRVQRLAPLHDLPDAVFVEDTAVVLDNIAVISRPGASSRRLETASVARALEGYVPLCFIEPPGTLDGGDVLRVGKMLYVGISTRTNQAGAEMLDQISRAHDHVVRPVPVRGCLHLKSAVTAIDDTTVLLNPEWVERGVFGELDVVEVDPQEPRAANVLRLGDVIVCAAGYPRTQARLERRGCQVYPVDLSELAKAEGAVTCCSIIVETPRTAAVAA